MREDKILEFLKSKEFKNIKYYMLVNNDGYSFEYKGVKFDLRHWRNVYGVETNFYSLMNNTTPLNYKPWITEFTKEIENEANKILKGE